jgi:hypothetical protein
MSVELFLGVKILMAKLKINKNIFILLDSKDGKK